MVRDAGVPSRDRSHLSSPSTRPGLLALGWAVLSMSFVTPSLSAQERERERSRSGPSVLTLIASTRAMGLGGAFRVGGDGDHAIFHHPALISGQGFDLSLGGVYDRDGGRDRHRDRERDDDRSPDDAIHLTLSASGTWLGGNVAAGLAVFDYGGHRDIDLPRERERDPARGGRSATAADFSWGVTEFVGTVGYGRSLFGFDVGAAGKVIGWTAGGARARTVAADVGVAREIGPVATALTVQNLGPDLEIGGRHVPVSRRVVLGAGTRRRAAVGPLDVGGAVQVVREHGGEVWAGGGVEVAYWPIVRRVFIARIGVAGGTEGDGSPLTFGAGFEGDRVRLDYGYRDGGGVTGPHRVGISIR